MCSCFTDILCEFAYELTIRKCKVEVCLDFGLMVIVKRKKDTFAFIIYTLNKLVQVTNHLHII